VLRIDSPGGEAAGAMACHHALRELREKYQTPIYCYADELAASAAYALACAGDEIWLPNTGTVGSIGVIATVFDRTKQNSKHGLKIKLLTSGAFKADGHADRPLTDEIEKRQQERVDTIAAAFFDVVADARGTTPEAVAALEAGVFIGDMAVTVGLADGVARWSEFLRIVAGTLDDF
jgi:ClpP class serine protease